MKYTLYAAMFAACALTLAACGEKKAGEMPPPPPPAPAPITPPPPPPPAPAPAPTTPPAQ